nr:hypothetical protein [Variovorax boronicumulans]
MALRKGLRAPVKVNDVTAVSTFFKRNEKLVHRRKLLWKKVSLPSPAQSKTTHRRRQSAAAAFGQDVKDAPRWAVLAVTSQVISNQQMS